MARLYLAWCGFALIAVLSGGRAAEAGLTAAAARPILRQAYDAFERGDYAKARDLALQVYEALGDVGACWVGPGGWTPPPEIDFTQDAEEVGRRVLQAYHRAWEAAHGEFVGRLALETTTARYLLWQAYARLGEYSKAAPLLEQHLSYLPAEIRDAVVRDLRDKGVLRPYPRPWGPPAEPRFPKWTRARWAAALIGATVYWDDTRREAIFSREGRFFVVRPGEATATLDGQAFQLEAVPYIQNDRLILPLSALTQAFGITLTEAQIEQVTYRLAD